jgi:hypothetical protein
MESKIKVLVVGCSITKGHGLKCESSDPELWVNRLFPEEKYEIVNLAKTGHNNSWIFLETMSGLLTDTYDIVLVGWSAIPRFNFHVGLELYSVHTMLNEIDVNINNKVVVSGKWLKTIGDSLREIHNDHWDFLDLVKYVNTLIQIQEKKNNGKIFFVNTLGPWPYQYFTKKQINQPIDLALFEQELLQIDTRDDDEIYQLYDMIHKDYETYGGIQEAHWLNLYSSLRSMQVDNVSYTDLHPGYQSQSVFYHYLIPILQKKLKIMQPAEIDGNIPSR